MGVPNIFANSTAAIPLSYLDVNFATPATLGNASVGLGNTTTQVGNLVLSNVTITSGTINASYSNVGNIVIGNTTANIGSAVGVAANSAIGNLVLYNPTVRGQNYDAVPQMRLTLVSATPVMNSDQTAKANVFYTAYTGNVVPVYDGQYMGWFASPELSVTLDAANALAGNIYDLFVSFDGTGAIRLGYGPAWTSNTARGTGAGTTELVRSNGIWTNKNQITLRGNSTSTFVANAALATYVGSFVATANGQTGLALNPAAAAGGSNTYVGLYNAYNRVKAKAFSADSTGSWTYGTAAYRAANGSNNNRITVIDGLQEMSIDGQYYVMANVSAGQTATGGVSIDGVSAPSAPNVNGNMNSTNTITIVARATSQPKLGVHFVQAVEFSTGANATFFGSTNAGLFADVEI